MLQLLLFIIWSFAFIQFVQLTCLVYFNGGPYDKEKWRKHWFKKLTIIYWKLLAKFKKGKLVILYDYEEKVYLSIASPHIEGNPEIQKSYVYFLNKVGPIELHNDGSVTREFRPFYIYNWLPFDTDERICMILQNDAKNFNLVFV